MNRHSNPNGIRDNLGNLVEDTRALLAATADVAGDKVAAARERVASALEAAKETYAGAQKNAVAGAKAADKLVRDHPYHAIGIAFGAGALIGLLLARRH
jgi:ElaB/YqjD/DUF883 family membrane-anchored ribosome-binding protein